MSKKIALLGLLIILLVINWSIFKKEQHLKHGKIVYLELLPKDPRAFMLGDYMELDFSIKRKISKALPQMKKRSFFGMPNSQDAYVIVSLNEKKVATFKEIDEGRSLLENELRLEYRVRYGMVKFAASKFFFEEGKNKLYGASKYGKFRVNSEGVLLLVDMYDENLRKIKG